MRMTGDMTIAGGPRAAAPAEQPGRTAARLIARAKAHLDLRRTERRLLLMSDEALRDIGVSRAELEARNPGAPSRGRMRPDI